MQKTYKTQSEYSKIYSFIERKLFFPAGSNHQKYLATNEAGELKHYAFKRTYRPRYLPDHLEFTNSISLDNPRVKNPLDVLCPLKKHISGERLYGIVKGAESKSLPFFAPDLDRHSDEDPEQFIKLCEVVHDELSKLNDYHFLQQTNRKNGSTKYFVFHKGLKQIPINMVTDVADNFKERIFEITGKEIEVFGSSKDHLCLLPLHPHKSFLTDAGRLGKERAYTYTKQYKINDVWFTAAEIDEMAANTCNRFAFRDSLDVTTIKKKRTHYWRPSISEFYKAYNRKYSVSKEASLHEIRKYASLSCRQQRKSISLIHTPNRITSTSKPVRHAVIPDTVSQAARKPSVRPQNDMGELKLAERHQCKIDELRNEPDAKRRQLHSCFILANVLKRPPTANEATDFIRDYDLYSGEWVNHKRPARIRGIVNFISRTFDAGKCGSGKSFKFDPERSGAYEWAAKKFQSDHVAKHESHQGLRIDPTTLAVTGDGRVYKRNAKVTVREIAQYFELMEECRKTSKHGDGGIPEDRAEEMWSCLYDTAQVETAWNSHRFRYVRDLLHGLGILICDYIKTRNKSYCYQTGKYHPFEKRWKQEANLSQASKKHFEMISTAPQPMKLPSFSINIFTEKSTVEADAHELVSCGIETDFSSASLSHQYKHNTESVDDLSVFEEVRQNDLLNRPPP